MPSSAHHVPHHQGQNLRPEWRTKLLARLSEIVMDGDASASEAQLMAADLSYLRQAVSVLADENRRLVVEIGGHACSLSAWAELVRPSFQSAKSADSCSSPETF